MTATNSVAISIFSSISVTPLILESPILYIVNHSVRLIGTSFWSDKAVP
jgi:hypothetical protein